MAVSLKITVVVKQILFLVFIFVLLTGCAESNGIAHPSPISTNHPIEKFYFPTSTSSPGELTGDEVYSLQTLKQVDDYPLYTMEYKGTYLTGGVLDIFEYSQTNILVEAGWGCSLFAALADSQNGLYGRNFDWFYSPVLLLYTDPPDGYASVSLVDMAYLDLPMNDIAELTNLPIEQIRGLLAAPNIPFDGMNEHGLVVGMAAVPSGNVQPDPKKENRESLEIIREILDHARNIDEALALFERFNVLMEEVPIHYLIASADGQSALVEYFQGQMIVTRPLGSYQVATNFLVAEAGADPSGNCWRFDRIEETLKANDGVLTIDSALALLSQVAQPNTQWSAIYSLHNLEVHLVLGKDFQSVHHFDLKKLR